MEMKPWNLEDGNLKGNARNGRDGGVVVQSQRVAQDEPMTKELTFKDYFVVLNTLKELENRFGHASIEGIIKILELMQTHEELRRVDPTLALTLLSRVNPSECSQQQNTALGGLAGLLMGRNRNAMEKTPVPAGNMGGGAPWFPGMVGDGTGAQMNHVHADGAAQTPIWNRASLYGMMDGLHHGQKRPHPQFGQQDGLPFNPHPSTTHGIQQQGWGNRNMPGNVMDLVGMHKAAQVAAGRAPPMDFPQYPEDQNYGQPSEPIVAPPVSLVRESLVHQYGSPLQRVEKKLTNSSYLVRFNVTVDMSEKLFPKTPRGRLDKSLPEQEREEYKSIFKHEINLVDVNGGVHSVRYEGIISSNQRHNRLTTGWCAAARSIGISVGDNVIFERWTNDRTMIHFYVEKNPYPDDHSTDSATPTVKRSQLSKRRKMSAPNTNVE